MQKNIDRESDNLKKNSQRFNKLKSLKLSTQPNNTGSNHDSSESNGGLIDNNESETQNNQLILSENKIKSMGDIASYRNSRIKTILEQTKLV